MTKLMIVTLDGICIDSSVRKAAARIVAGSNKNKLDPAIFLNPAMLEFDVPVAGVAQLLDKIEAEGWQVIFLSSRPDSMVVATRAWLVRYNYIKPDHNRSLILKQDKEKYIHNATWKASMVKRLAQQMAATHVIFVDNEPATTDAVATLTFPGLTVYSTLLEAIMDLPLLN